MHEAKEAGEGTPTGARPWSSKLPQPSSTAPHWTALGSGPEGASVPSPEKSGWDRLLAPGPMGGFMGVMTMPRAWQELRK